MKLPKEMVAQMRSDIEADQAAVTSAMAALEAVCLYPPIKVVA